MFWRNLCNLTFIFFLKNLNYCSCGEDRVSGIIVGRVEAEAEYRKMLSKYSVGTGMPSEDPVCHVLTEDDRMTMCRDTMTALKFKIPEEKDRETWKYGCSFREAQLEDMGDGDDHNPQLMYPCPVLIDGVLGKRYLGYGYSATMLNGFNLFVFEDAVNSENQRTPSIGASSHLETVILSHYIDLYTNNKFIPVVIQKIQKLTSKLPKKVSATAGKCLAPKG